MVLLVRRYVIVEMAPVVIPRLEPVFVFLGGLEKIVKHVGSFFASIKIERSDYKHCSLIILYETGKPYYTLDSLKERKIEMSSN